MSTLLASGHVLIGANISPAMAGMAKVNAQFARTGNSLTRTGSTITKAIGLPIAAAFAYSIKAAADFESALNDMQAVSGATNAQMKKVGATAKALGADVRLPGTSAKDAADAMVQLAKGGLTADQAMKAARGTLQLSAAAGIDNAQAATIQADALNSFGLSAKNAGRVADILAASANSSTAEITDMAQALAQSSSVAHQAGWSIEDTATALSMLANAGIKGSDAGTSVKTMVQRLVAPMGAGAAAISKYHLNLRDANGELLKQAPLAQEFTKKLGGLGKAQRDAAMAAIFGSDAIRAGNVLLGASTGAIDKQRAASTKQGAAAALAAAKMKGFNGQVEALKSAAQTAAISLGQILLPVALSLAKGLTSAASAFESLSPEMKKVVVAGLTAAAVLGPLIIIAGKLAVALKALGLTAAIATGPVGLIILGLVALGVGLYVAWQRSETFRQVVTTAFEAIKSVAIPVIQAVTAAVAQMAAFFQRHWGEISATASAAMARIKTAITVGLAVIKALWAPFWPVLSAAVKAAWSVIAAVVSSNLRTIGNVIRAIMAVIRGDWSAAWAAIKAAGLAQIQGFIATMRALLTGLVSVAAALARSIGKSIISGIKAGLSAIRSIYSPMWSGISGAISSAAGAALSAAASIGRAIVSGAVNAMSGLAGALRAKAESAISSALSGLNPFSPVEHGGAIYIGKPIIDGAVKAIHQNSPRLSMALSKTVREAVMAAKANAADLAGGLAGMIGTGVDALTGRRLSDLNASSEAQQLRVIEKAQKAAQTERERIRLQDAIDNAESLDDQQQAVGDMNDWLLEQQRQALADQLAVKEQQIRDEADARKTAAERGLADLTNQFNQGLIKQDAYMAGVRALIAASVGDYTLLGGLLGGAFHDGFVGQLDALTQQIGLIAGGPQAKGGVGGPSVVNPAAVQNAEQRQRLADKLTSDREKLATAQGILAKKQDAVDKARAAATKASSPGGTAITSAESATIAAAQAALRDQQGIVNIWAARAADSQKALQTWNAAHKAKRGGLIGGSGLADKVPLLAAPGEGVLDHRKMDSLWSMAMNGRRGGAGGGPSVTVNVTVTGSVIGDGGRRALARDLAALVKPELNRLVSLTA